MKRNLIVLSCLLVFLAFNGSQAMAVDVYGEGAYSDTNSDVQICIYADIGGSEALRSFGVRLTYDESELTFDGSRSSKNEAVWYLKDEEGVLHDYPHGGPENVGGAVVIIGGVLDTDKAYKVSGDRVLLGTVWFTRVSGSGPLSNNLTLDLGKDALYANFVSGPEVGDVLDNFVSFLAVDVYERGDADGSGEINVFDIIETRKIIENAGYSVWADCLVDGEVNVFDIICVRNKL
jgi:hypothetical protein